MTGVVIHLNFNSMSYSKWRSKSRQRQKGVKQGGNSQNFLGKFVRFFVTLRCFYRVVIHKK